MKVAIVARIGFDGLENEIGNAISRSVAAVFVDDADNMADWKAMSFVHKKDNPLERFKGRDGQMYPKWEVSIHEAQ